MTLSFFSRIKSRAWEKIPSTFVVVVLTIHVLGLGAAVFVLHCAGTEQAKQAVATMVGESLAHFAQEHATLGLDQSAQFHQALSEFNMSKRWDELRVIAFSGEIVGSLHKEEKGTKHWQARQLPRDWPVGLVTEWEDRGSELLERVRFRVPLGSADGEKKLIIEGVVRIAPLVPVRSALNGPIIVVFIGSFVLLLLYCRLMHKRILPLTRIGSNLLRHRSRLHEEISSLRLASETDSVAKAWNQLMGLFEEMRDSAAQASAYRELNTALERSASSAFVEATNVVPEGVMYIARGERLCYANKMACRLLGIEFEADSARSGGGHKLLGDLPVSDLGQKIVAAVQSAKASQQFESRSVNVEGESESAFRVRVMPVLQKDPGAIVLITDVSQQAKADAAREAFLAQVTHELRTPLTNIRAYTETYAEFDDPKVQAECFNVINKETRRLARLVEEMLSRSQLDVGSMTVRRDDVDLLSLVGESVRDLNATAKSKGIDLQAKLPSKLPALRADRDKLSVVVNNLLGNALKYTESGGSVSIGCQADDEQVRILVSDTGIGIGADDQLRIFEHLYRVDSQEVRTQLGSGIGLTTALEIIKAHGGDINVKSESGKGSTFTIELPLAAAAAGREA